MRSTVTSGLAFCLTARWRIAENRHAREVTIRVTGVTAWPWLSTSGLRGVGCDPCFTSFSPPTAQPFSSGRVPRWRRGQSRGRRRKSSSRHPALPRSAHRDPAVFVRGTSGVIAESAARHGGTLLRKGFTVAQVVHDYGGVCQAVTELADETRAPITPTSSASSTGAWTTPSRRRSPSTRASASSRSPTRGASSLGELAHAAAHSNLRCFSQCPTPPSVPPSTPSPTASPTPSSRRSGALPSRTCSPSPAERDVAPVALEARRRPRPRQRLPVHRLRPAGRPAAFAAERPRRSPSRSPGAIEGNTNAFLGYVNGPGREKQVEKQVKKEAEKRVQKQGDQARSAHVVSILPPAVRVGSGCMVLVAQQAAIRLTASDASEGSPGGCSAQAVGSPARDEAKRPAPLAGAGLGQPADLQNNSAGPHRLLTAGSQVRVLQPEPPAPKPERDRRAFSQGPRV